MLTREDYLRLMFPPEEQDPDPPDLIIGFRKAIAIGNRRAKRRKYAKEYYKKNKTLILVKRQLRRLNHNVKINPESGEIL